MGFKNRTVDELMKIVSHGGGLRIDGTHRSVDELKRILSVVGPSKPRIVISGMLHKTSDEMCQIASISVGNVQFED